MLAGLNDTQKNEIREFIVGQGEYSGVIYTANPDVETDDSGKSETDIPA